MQSQLHHLDKLPNLCKTQFLICEKARKALIILLELIEIALVEYYQTVVVHHILISTPFQYN